MSDEPIRLQLDENPDPEPQHTTKEASPEDLLREKLKRLEETRLLLEEKRRQQRTYLEAENEKLNTISLNGLPPKKRRIWTSKWMIICYILIFLAAGGVSGWLYYQGKQEEAARLAKEQQREEKRQSRKQLKKGLALYKEGNYAKAVELFRKAAELKNKDAQYWLGVCCENGQGVEIDLDQAQEWYQKAADQGHEKAKENLRKLEEKIRQARIVKEEPTKTIYLDNGVSLTMIGVEPGSFMMGSENGFDDEKPVHQVTLTKPYYLGETEVTQAQWRAVMGNNPSRFQGDIRPVENVSWDDAMAFCKKLNEQGKAPRGWKFTLPTEAQWEFAARGGSRSRGYTYSGSNDVDDVAWYTSNSGSGTHAVRQKEANELGLYDMSGNVWEWCLDGSRSYSSSAVTDPQGPDSGSRRVLRGGGWDFNAHRCRSVYRFNYSPGLRGSYCGFRLALVPIQ